MCMTRLLCVIMYKNGREKMWQFILGSAGFLLYFIYDINSIKKKNTFFQKFFAWGTVLVVLSLVMELWLSWGQCQHRIGRIIGFGTGALCFLALLIYTLFFALPFEETYCEENKLRGHIQRVCTVCAVIPEFYGSQEQIFACGECLADGDRESIFCL